MWNALKHFLTLDYVLNLKGLQLRKLYSLAHQVPI